VRTIEHRVFLCGCPRSGTTLLQALLASHPDLTSLPETRFVASTVGWHHRWPHALSRRTLPWFLVARARGWLRLSGSTRYPLYRRVLTELGYGDLAERAVSALPRSQGTQIRLMVDALDRMALARGRRGWIEKSNENVFYVPVIERYVPDASFVHVLRDGRENVASLHELPSRYPAERWGAGARWCERYRDVDNCIRDWGDYARAIRRLAGRANHVVVDYEELVERPEDVLRDVVSAVGLEYSPRMLETYRDTAAALRTPDEPWKESVSGPWGRDGTKFERLFDEEAQAAILRRVRSLEAECC
jgi:hypothetical protein